MSTMRSTGWIILLFFCAITIRWIPISFGLPYLHYWDEPTYIKLSLNTVKTGEFDHQWYRIPPFFLYQHAVVQVVRFWKTVQEGHRPAMQEIDLSKIDQRELSDLSILRWSRKYTALLGTLMCLLTYLIARQFLDPPKAIAAGFGLAFMPGHIEHSLFITPDIPMAFLVLLTVYLSIQTPKGAAPFRYFCLGMLAGLTAATKYNGGCVWLVPCMLLLLDRQCGLPHWVLLIFGTVAGFTIGFPYWFLRIPQWINGVGEEIYHYNHSFLQVGINHSYGWDYLRYLIDPGMGWILFGLLMVGLWKSRRFKPSGRWIVFWMFPVVYVLLLLNQQANLNRNLMPLTPWLAMGAGIGFLAVGDFMRSSLRFLLRFLLPTSWSSKGSLVVWAILVMGIVLPPLLWANSIHRSQETRVQMADWITSNTPKESVIGIPSDLRFRDSDLQRMDRPIVLLTPSDIDHQSLWGIDLLVCGAQPGHMQWLNIEYGHGNLNPGLERKKAVAFELQRFIESLTPLHTVFCSHLYPPRSTLFSFWEGWWLLDEFSVNPDLIAASIIPNSVLVFQPIREGDYTVDQWDFMAPQWNRSIRGNPLRIHGVSYPEGIGIHANSTLRISIPPNAKRFLVDIGISDDLEDKAPSSIRGYLELAQQGIYSTPLLRRSSPAWRFELPIVQATEIKISLRDAGDGNSFDNAVLGHCGFLVERVFEEEKKKTDQ